MLLEIRVAYGVSQPSADSAGVREAVHRLFRHKRVSAARRARLFRRARAEGCAKSLRKGSNAKGSALYPGKPTLVPDGSS